MFQKLGNNKVLEGLDGVVWVRKTIVLSDEDLAGNAVLYLGKLMTKTLLF